MVTRWQNRPHLARWRNCPNWQAGEIWPFWPVDIVEWNNGGENCWLYICTYCNLWSRKQCLRHSILHQQSTIKFSFPPAASWPCCLTWCCWCLLQHMERLANHLNPAWRMRSARQDGVALALLFCCWIPQSLLLVCAPLLPPCRQDQDPSCRVIQTPSAREEWPVGRCPALPAEHRDCAESRNRATHTLTAREDKNARLDFLQWNFMYAICN